MLLGAANPKQLVQHDDLDTRRELHTLLNSLHPLRRLGFLRWCCQHATLPGATIKPCVLPETVELAKLACRDDSAGPRLTAHIVTDMSFLSLNYDFSLSAALVELERRGRATR